MRLAAKLVLLFLSGLLLIVALFTYLSLERERELAMADHERYAAELARLAAAKDLQQKQQRQTPRGGAKVTIRRVEMTSGGGEFSPSVPRDRILLTEQITTYSLPNDAGGRTLYTYVPFDESAGDDARKSHLEVSAPDERAPERARRAWLSTLLAIGGVGTLSALVILFGGITMVGNPLRELIDKVNRAAEGDFENDLELRTRDELSTLADAINQMCQKLHQQHVEIETESAARVTAIEQLRHSDRLRSVGRIASGVAHEIGTPLSVISGHAELISDDDDVAESARHGARTIKRESDRIKQIISGLLDFARRSQPSRQPTDLATLARQTAELLTPIARRKGITLETQLPEEDAIVSVDEQQIQQVLTNLIDNAMESRGTTQIIVGVRDVPGADFRELFVTDDGEGISQENLSQVFEPFYTTKDVGEGTGLGLSISHGIVEENGGSIDVQSEPGKGCTFLVKLPLPTDATEQVSGDRSNTDE